MVLCITYTMEENNKPILQLVPANKLFLMESCESKLSFSQQGLISTYFVNILNECLPTS